MQVTKSYILRIKYTLGENGREVNIDITRKYIFAALRNWRIKLFGAQLIKVYLIIMFGINNLPRSDNFIRVRSIRVNR